MASAVAMDSSSSNSSSSRNNGSKRSLCSLPEDVHPLIFEFLVGAKTPLKDLWGRPVGGHYKRWKDFRRGLKRLPEVCRAFGVVWTLTPKRICVSKYTGIAAHTVNCEAAARVMRKMGARIEELSLTV
jgi:hypothetical protein